MALKLDIANAALTKLGEQTLVDLTSPTRNSARINAIFAISLDEVLISNSWSESIRTVTISNGQDLSALIEGHRVLKVLNSIEGQTFSISGGQFVAGGPVRCRAVVRLPETTDFGPFLTTVLVAKLAYELAGTRPSQRNANYEEYLRVLAQASSSDSQQEGGTANRFEYGTEIIDVR